MSLDFPEITDAFRQFLMLPVRQIAHSFEALSKWLDQRVRKANLLEQASRRFPTIRFEGDAVSMRLDRLQAGALAPDAPAERFSAHVVRAGGRFVQGLGTAAGSVRNELVLPTAVATLGAAVDAIADSVARFAHPPGEMSEQLFGHSGVADNDPMHRTAIDLFGEAALAWRSVAGSTRQLRGFVDDVGYALKLLRPVPDANTGVAVDPMALPDSLENIGREILAGLLVIPALPALVVSLWESLVIAVKFGVVEAFARIEARVNSLRKKVIEFFFIDLRMIVRKVLSYATAAHLVLVANLHFFADFALAYGDVLIGQLRTFFDDIAKVVNDIIALVNGVLDAINSVLQFDLAPYIEFVVGLPSGTLPSLTVDDLITAGTEFARAQALQTLTMLTGFLPDAVSQPADGIPGLIRDSIFPPGDASTRVAAIPVLIRNALRPQPQLPPETAALKWPAGYGFPNLYDTFVRPGLPALRGAIDGIAREFPKGVGDILGEGSAALNVLGDEFEEEAARSAAMGSTERFRQIAETAGRQAHDVFGPDIEALQGAIARRPVDPVAEAFEDWLATGGFLMLGEAIPAYFDEMRAFWREKEAEGREATVRIDMTSPRILAQRAALARSVVRHVVVRAAGKAVNKELAAEVAVQFRMAVQQAYLDGKARLELYGASEYI